MIVKYPVVLLALIPILCLFWIIRNQSNIHTIRFPKTQWMTQLKSSRAMKQLKLTQWIEILAIILVVITIAQPQYRSVKTETNKKRN